MTDALLAIDLGTSSTKLIVVGGDGAVLARRRLPHATHLPAAGAAEQDPEAWWGNLAVGVTKLHADLPIGTRIAAIGVTGQMHGLVAHDAAGAVLRPAVIWEDRRSAAALAALLARLPAAHPRIAPGYQAASWHWLSRTEPELASRVAWLLLPKDEIVHRLTGTRVTDPSDAVGTGWYRVESGSWDETVAAAAGARVEMLPAIIPAGSIAGGLADAAAAALGLPAGIPVITAGGDAAVAAFGAGATCPGTPLVMLSTGCQALLPCEAMPETDAWPSANPPGLPRWLRVATTLNGGNAVRWARETFGEPAAMPDPELVFLPYLAGARAMEVGPDASGAFIGLRERHGPADLARAAIDGVALALVGAFEHAGGSIGGEAPVLAGGGGTRDGAWLASVAAAIARPVAAVAEPDLSAWGAARAAATALGWIDPVGSPDAWRPSMRIVASPASREDALARLDRFHTLSRRLFAPEDR